MTVNSPQSFWLAIMRGILGRCPNCGIGKLFAKYLKPVNNCALCAEHLGTIRADDGPAWLTILIVGHLLAPFIIIFAFADTWPDWLSISLWSILATILALVILPRSKGLFIAIIWRLNNSSVKRD
jgi:uncharacterized protein (DUF983 family)